MTVCYQRAFELSAVSIPGIQTRSAEDPERPSRNNADQQQFDDVAAAPYIDVTSCLIKPATIIQRLQHSLKQHP